MSYRGAFLAVAVVLAGNVVALIGVVRNRSGGLRASIELTERELRIPAVEEENTGLFLELRWESGARWWPHRFEDGPGWFDRRKLEELGYDCRLDPADPAAEKHYQRAMSIEAFVVLEYEGEAWRQWLAKPPEPPATRFREPAIPPDPERERLSHTRLFAVDVGRDASPLRQKYADPKRFLIVRGVVRLVREWRATQVSAAAGPYLRGAIAEVLIQRIHVPLEHRGALEAFRKESSLAYFGRSPLESLAPRFAVTVAIGSLYDPWIVAVQPRQR